MKKLMIAVFLIINFAYSKDKDLCHDYKCIGESFICKDEADKCEQEKKLAKNYLENIKNIDILKAKDDDINKSGAELIKSFYITKDLTNLKFLLDNNKTLINQKNSANKKLLDMLLYMPVYEFTLNLPFDKEQFYKTLKLLLSYKPDLNYPALGIDYDKAGATPLTITYALPYQNEDIIKISDLLLENGADIEFAKKFGDNISIARSYLHRYNFELFSYYLQKESYDSKIFIDCIMTFLVDYVYELMEYYQKELDDRYFEIVNSTDFKEKQIQTTKFLKEYLKHRNLKNEPTERISASIKRTLLANNMEALKLLINNGALDDIKIRQDFIPYVKKFKKQEILDLIKAKYNE